MYKTLQILFCIFWVSIGLGQEVPIIACFDNQVNEDFGIPVALIEKVPIYPGCYENDSNIYLQNCLSMSIQQYVTKSFNIGLADELGLEGFQKIQIQFKINKRGESTIINVRAPHPLLQEEAIRVIESLPKMKAGEQHGKTVDVLYSLPIVLKVE